MCLLSYSAKIGTVLFTGISSQAENKKKKNTKKKTIIKTDDPAKSNKALVAGTMPCYTSKTKDTVNSPHSNGAHSRSK